MARLIDANKFMRETYFQEGIYPHLTIKKEIEAQPTVDAVEVVHGRWEDVRETEMYVPDMRYTITKTAETCSECKARIGFVGAKRYLFDTICPNCGAKMDGGVNDGSV